MLSELLSGLSGWIVAGLVAVAGVIGVYLRGRRTGRERAELEVHRDREEAEEAADELRQDIDGAGPDAVRDGLSEWARRR